MGMMTKMSKGMFEFGTKRAENLFTGIELTGTGKAAAGLYGAGTIGKALFENKHNLNQQPAKPARGVSAPPQLSYDGRTNSMGADGDLALALSKLS